MSLSDRVVDWDTGGVVVKTTARNTLLRYFGGNVTWGDIEAWCYRPGVRRHRGPTALRAYLHGIGPKAVEVIAAEIRIRGGRA